MSHLRSISRRLMVPHYSTTPIINYIRIFCPFRAIFFWLFDIARATLAAWAASILGPFLHHYFSFSSALFCLIADCGPCGRYGGICFEKIILFFYGTWATGENVISPWLWLRPRKTYFEIGQERLVAISFSVFIRQLDSELDIPEKLFVWVCGGTEGRGMDDWDLETT